MNEGSFFSTTAKEMHFQHEDKDEFKGKKMGTHIVHILTHEQAVVGISKADKADHKEHKENQN